ncbi:toxic anion resistance protein [bacterium]|nr:toxic anion resistance protein [bacterium]
MMTTETSTETKPETTAVVNPMQKKKETKPKVKKELLKVASDNLKELTDFNFEDIDKQIEVEGSVESLGIDLQRDVANKSALLSTTVGDLSEETESGDLATALIGLRDQVEIVNPNKHSFEPGFLTSFVGKFFPSFLSKPLKNYMTKFRTAESVINEIVNGIAEGQKMLERDNITLQDRVVELRKLDQKLNQAIQVGQVMDDDLLKVIETETDADKKKFFKQKVLIKLRTRIVDLQTVRAVAQQGIMSMDLTVDTNKLLVQNAERTRTVTVAALKIAVELRKALSNQKKMLEVINAVNSTTNDLIVGNSELLKDNVVAVNKGAMEATLNIDSLKTAFSNIYQAFDEVEKFKEEALPRLKETIGEFNNMSGEAEKKINSMERGKQIEGKVNLKLT